MHTLLFARSGSSPVVHWLSRLDVQNKVATACFLNIDLLLNTPPTLSNYRYSFNQVLEVVTVSGLHPITSTVFRWNSCHYTATFSLSLLSCPLLLQYIYALQTAGIVHLLHDVQGKNILPLQWACLSMEAKAIQPSKTMSTTTILVMIVMLKSSPLSALHLRWQAHIHRQVRMCCPVPQRC